MKKVQKFALAIVLITLFATCQRNSEVKQILSKAETKKALIDTIANDSIMSKEMIFAMLNSKNGKMVMMENHKRIMKMMKEKPDMRQMIMSDMMEACKNDSGMMSSMCKTMMENHQVMCTMHKIKEKCKDMKNMKGMDKTKK